MLSAMPSVIPSSMPPSMPSPSMRRSGMRQATHANQHTPSGSGTVSAMHCTVSATMHACHADASPHTGPGMKDYGQGYCRNGYLRGWDGKGTGSQAACNAVCMAETDCTYAAWNNGKTCSRYKEASCKLNGVRDHYTYKKTFRVQGSQGEETHV